MIGKITVGAGLWIALQFSTFEVASDQGKAVIAQAGIVQQHIQDSRCVQARASHSAKSAKRACQT